MSSSVSIHVDNISEGLYNHKCTNYKFRVDYIASKDNH